MTSEQSENETPRTGEVTMNNDQTDRMKQAGQRLTRGAYRFGVVILLVTITLALSMELELETLPTGIRALALIGTTLAVTVALFDVYRGVMGLYVWNREPEVDANV